MMVEIEWLVEGSWEGSVRRDGRRHWTDGLGGSCPAFERQDRRRRLRGRDMA
jgi:hypothetical protein